MEALSKEQRVNWDRLAGRKQELDKARKSLDPSPHGLQRHPEPAKEPSHLLERGNPMKPGKVVPPAT